MQADIIKKTLCGLWFIVLLAGLNFVFDFINSGILILVFLFFLLADLVFPKLSIVIKLVVSLLLVHRNYYIGSFFNPQWLTWLAQDLSRDLAVISQQGFAVVQSTTAMVLTLATVILMQTIFVRVFLRGKGITFFLCFGAALLAAAYLWKGDVSPWYTIFFVMLGLIIKATLPIEIKATFPMGRWLRILLATVLALTAVAWALPDPGLDFSSWLGEGVAWKYDPFAPPRGRVGYSAYDGVLGGSLTDDDTPALRVTTPGPVYLRGESRWQYTGSGWESSVVIQEDFPKLVPEHLEGNEIEISVEVLAPANLIFTPRYPLKIEVEGGSFNVFSPMDVQTVFPYEHYLYSSQLKEGETYRLSVLLPADDPDALRQLTCTQIDSKYFSLENVTNRVYELAHTVVADETNGYDKAVAIATFLRYGWNYSLDSQAPPQGEDFVEDFLFNKKEGYCAHFSTAFVVMARSVGLPARWVKGYSYGTWEKDGVYIVRNNNAHSWAEVWFDGYGWIPFEPTPGGVHLRPEVGVTPPDIKGPTTPIPGDQDPAPDPGPKKPKPETPKGKDPVKWWPYVAVGAVLVLASAVFFLLWRRREGIGIREAYARLQTRLRFFGWQRRRWETPREHFDRVDSLPNRPKLKGFVRRFEDSVYGGAEEPQKNERQLGKGYSLVGLIIHRLTRAKGN